MKIAAHRGTRLHAPENSRAALLSAYVAGAQVLEFDLQLTADGYLVLSHDGTTQRLTGEEGTIRKLPLAALKEMDWSQTFRPRNTETFSYYTREGRKLAPLVFPAVLEWLPEDVEFLLELKHDSSAGGVRREEFVQKAVEALQQYRVEARTVVYSKDTQNILLARQLAPHLRIAAFDYEKSVDEQLALLADTGADGLVTDLDSVYAHGQLTPFGLQLQTYCTQHELKVGAVLYPFRQPGLFTRQEYEGLKDHRFVWSLSTDSMLDVASFWRPSRPMLRESFAGKNTDHENFAFGYAKANKYAEVFQNEGVRVVIDPYNGTFPPPSADPLERRLERVEHDLLYTAKDWPYYSGGGVGYLHGIRGDFSAEVSYTVQNVGQATTLEMAVLNVDPGTHVAGRPKSFRDKDSFYDPHGAPPYVGVEHDENDGFRINWNLGSEYDNNQYGRPVGDGATPRGARLRLDRRGPFFAAYYRDAVDENQQPIGPGDWVCVGVTRNDSLNPVLFLRCVGKRWRQEKEKDPSQFEPILANEFCFTNLLITCFAPVV